MEVPRERAMRGAEMQILQPIHSYIHKLQRLAIGPADVGPDAENDTLSQSQQGRGKRYRA